MRYFPNWKGFLATVTVIGAALCSATASATMTALPASNNPTTKVVYIGVIVNGWARTGYQPLGDVTFTESNNTLGVGSLYCFWPYAGTVGCQAFIAVDPGYALGPHTITATWSGDRGNAPEALTFRIYVSELAWLPTVLDPLAD